MPRSRLRTTIAIAVVVVALLVTGGTAYAVWSASGTGSGATQAASLVTPSVTATPTAGSTSSSVTLSWTAPSQLPGVTYSVKRNNVTVAGCTSSPCTDSGLTAGTAYTYVVTAALGSWTATGSASTTTAASGATKIVVNAPASTTAGANTTVTLTAQNASGATVTSYSGSKSLTWSGTAAATSITGATATLPASATFTNGVATISTVNLKTAGTGLVLTVSDGSIGGSDTLTVVAGAADRLGFTSVTYGTPATSVECRAGCAVPSNKGAISFKVSVTDTYGNLTTAPAMISANVKAGSFGSQGTLTIAKGATESGTNLSNNPQGQSVTITIDGGPGYTETENAKASLAPQ